MTVAIGHLDLVGPEACRRGVVGGSSGTTDGDIVEEPLVGSDGAVAIRIPCDGTSGQGDPFIEGTIAGDGGERALSVIDFGDGLISGGDGGGEALTVAIGPLDLVGHETCRRGVVGGISGTTDGDRV